MKVLMIGCYRDGTGYSVANTDYILALDAAGIDVVCRPLKLNERQVRPPQRILQLEQKLARDCDVVIQHTVPHLFSYDGHFKKCIGLFASETSSFRDSSWADRLNNLDEVWVINHQQVQACLDSGVTRPICVVPHATDITRFQCSHKPLEGLRPYREAGEFLFYTIGEFVQRKNLGALLRAFHTEFDPSEPVGLVIKTDGPESRARAFCDEIKRGMKLYGGRPEAYKEEILLTDRLTDDGILRLHASCDCFVSASHGEAWCLPGFDAMALGKTPIVPDWGGFREYISGESGWLVPCHEEPVYGVDDSFQDLYTGNETWAAVDIIQLRRCMREAYEEDSKREEKAAKGIERAYDFSHERIGAVLRGLLNGAGAGEDVARTS